MRREESHLKPVARAGPPGEADGGPTRPLARRPAPPPPCRAGGCPSASADLDAVYDLACQLTGDERAASRLLSAALRALEREPDGEPRRGSDLLAPLVQAYLRRARAPAGRLASLLGRRGDRSASVAAGLGRLTPEERVCLLLRERLGLPVDEVAAIAGLGREPAGEALRSARERLRRWLSVERVGEVARDGDAGKTGA